MDLFWIRRQLTDWGVRSRVRGIGYPTMSTTEKAIRGRGGAYHEPQLPPDLEEIDQAVRLLEPYYKSVIVECYTHYGTHAEHMGRLRLSKATYFRHKNVAEKRVYWLLNSETDFVRCA